MDEKELNKWPKSITVDKRIVGILSVSTYKNFPRALKEIITNSYDADATDVYIDIDIENEIVTIEDNGKGMNSQDFGFYLRIAGKSRRKENNETDLGRKIIGQFGVGFLSVFPFFKNYSIESSKAGSDKVIYGQIPLAKYFDPGTGLLVDVGSVSISGGEKTVPALKSKSFTKIVLSGFNELTHSFFKEPKETKKNEVETYAGIDKLKWILSDDLPVLFEDDRFNVLFKYPKSPQFNVYVNDIALYRGVYGDEILETHQDDFRQIGNIRFKYFIATPRKAVSPRDARSLKIRNLNVGVGDKRTDFGENRGGQRSRLHWLTGEVHIISGMNELIKVSRDDFNYSSDYEALKDFFNSRLQFYSTKLEEEATLKREFTQTGTEFRVSNIKLLDPKNLQRKIEKLEDQGFEIQTVSDKSGISINEEKKEIFIQHDLSNFEKHIVVNNRRFLVKSDTWDYRTDFFPACKVNGNVIIVNANYPLFKGLKYTDVFVKMHLLILMNYQDSLINDHAYKKLTDDILIFYSDY